MALVTDLPTTTIPRRNLPKGWTAHKAPDGETFIWDGRNHVSLGKGRDIVANASRGIQNLKAMREWEDAGRPPFRIADYA